MAEAATRNFSINFGPQHPAAHGVLRLVFGFFVALLFLPSLGRAGESVLSTNADLDRRIAGFDPRAVAAARHYFDQPIIEKGLVAIQSTIAQSVRDAVLKQNPEISSAEADRVVKAAGEISAERFELFLKISMVAQLETLSTDEVIALDRFYTSPEGLAIMAKTPQMAAGLSAMTQAIMPEAVNEMKAKLKGEGKELKP